MGDVAASGNQPGIGGTGGLPGDGLYLGGGAVFVLFPLDDEKGTADFRQVVFHVPRPEPGVEPGVRPVVKNAGGVLPVVGGEAFPEIGPVEEVHGLPDALEGDRFDEDVGGLGDDGGHLFRKPGGKKKGDGAAVAVSDEDGFFDPLIFKNVWERSVGFLVEILWPPGRFEGFRFSVAPAVENEPGMPRPVAQKAGEVLPLGHASEALVKEDENGFLPVPAVPLAVEATNAGVEKEGVPLRFHEQGPFGKTKSHRKTQ